jgi:NAD-dependent SIR2 family protein deacetylase
MESVTTDPIERVLSLLGGARAVALTGAGISTESGIPDYRGEGTRARAKSPIQHREFVGKPEVRARYWARSLAGFERFAAAEPNPAHHALASLESAGLVTGVVTQNVDELHQRAGSREVVELHGTLSTVKCLTCDRRESRRDLQARLRARTSVAAPLEFAPDGDAEVAVPAGFEPPGCLACGGILKPTVVFFGDNVPKPVVEAAFALVDSAECLLVFGTSLAVFSGYRFLLRAKERRIPIVAINLGPMRGSELCDLYLPARLGEALPNLAHAWLTRRGARASSPHR